jgi:hypothetical protein
MTKRKVSAARKALLRVRALIERGWAQGTFATTKTGTATFLGSDYAENVCLLGALHHVRDHDRPRVSSRTWCKVFELITARVGNMVEWNDSPERTQKQVLDLLDKVLAQA